VAWLTRDDVDAATGAASMAKLKNVITPEGNAGAQASRIGWLPNGGRYLSVAFRRL